MTGELNILISDSEKNTLPIKKKSGKLPVSVA